MKTLRGTSCGDAERKQLKNAELLLGVLDQSGEGVGLERGAADETAVDVLLSGQSSGVLGLHAAAVLDNRVLGDFSAEHVGQSLADERVGLLRHFRGSGLARSDRPDRLVGNRDVRHVGGGEVGVYTKDPETNDKLYNCADNDHLLNMYYDLYMTPNTYAVKDRFFYRDAWTGGGHWWLTGFKMGSVNPNEMVRSLKIRMRSRKMANAFEDGLQTAGFYRGNATSNYDSYYRNDTEFYILWYHTGNRNY